MAIGSNPEVGAFFKQCKDFTMEDWEEWWAWMRENWHPYLMQGYAVLVHNKEGNPYYDAEERRRRASIKEK